MKCIRLHHSKRWLLPVELAVTVIILQESCPSLHCDAPHVHSDLPTPPTFPPLTVKAERTPRSERKRRDSFGMYDGYESCSEESTSSSSSEDSDDEVVPSIPASLPIIKNNGQVYTYPDGKAGMGERLNGNFLFRCPSLFFFFSQCQWKEFAKCAPDLVKMLPLFSPTATCEMCGMVGVRDAFYSKTKRFCSVSCSRSYSSNSKKASILARLQVRASFAATVMYFAHYDQLVNIDEIFWCVFRANHQRKKQKFCRNSL